MLMPVPTISRILMWKCNGSKNMDVLCPHWATSIRMNGDLSWNTACISFNISTYKTKMFRSIVSAGEGEAAPKSEQKGGIYDIPWFHCVTLDIWRRQHGKQLVKRMKKKATRRCMYGCLETKLNIQKQMCYKAWNATNTFVGPQEHIQCILMTNAD